MRQLDGFNQLRPSASEEDEEDMAWPGIRRRSRLCSMSLAPIMLNILRMYIHVHVHVCTHVQCCILHVYTCLVYVGVCACIQTCIYNVHVYVLVKTCVCTCIYMNMYTCMCCRSSDSTELCSYCRRPRTAQPGRRSVVCRQRQSLRSRCCSS